MAKRKSALERAILDLEDQIAALEIARNHLIRLRITKAPPKATPRPVTPRPPRAVPEAS